MSKKNIKRGHQIQRNKEKAQKRQEPEKMNKTKGFFFPQRKLVTIFLCFLFKTSDTYTFNTQNKNTCKEMKKKKKKLSQAKFSSASSRDSTPFPISPTTASANYKAPQSHRASKTLTLHTQLIRQQSVWCVHANLTAHSLHNSISMMVVRYLQRFASKRRTTGKKHQCTP